MMDAGILSMCWGIPVAKAQIWAKPLTDAMAEFSINTPARQAAFIAQCGHESGGGRYKSEIWGPTPAQLRYEGRVDLGNTKKGDGSRFRGRGLIQITGRSNYKAVSDALHYDFVSDPEALEQPDMASASAAWFWKSRGLNELADDGDFKGITKKINGGLNGYADRLALWQAGQKVLGITV